MPYAAGVYTPPLGAENASPGQVIRSATWNAIFTDLSAAFTDIGTPAIEFVFDGGGQFVSSGVHGYLEIPFACSITGWKILADVVSSCQLDVWKTPFAGFPPLIGNSIVGSAPPTLTAAQKASSTTLTGWTTTINPGDILAFVVTSNGGVGRVTLSLNVGRN